MQDAPPDILVTNYSMLNIMLMRDIETPIFDATRAWLEADTDQHLPSRRRRTPYLSGNSGNRGRVHPSGPVRPARVFIRTIRSSASSRRARRLARTRPARRIICGSSSADRHPSHSSAAARRRYPAGAVTASAGWPARSRGLGPAMHADQPPALDAAIDAFARTGGDYRVPDHSLPIEQRLGEALGAVGAAEAVRAACNSGTDDNPTVRRMTLSAIGAAVSR